MAFFKRRKSIRRPDLQAPALSGKKSPAEKKAADEPSAAEPYPKSSPTPDSPASEIAGMNPSREEPPAVSEETLRAQAHPETPAEPTGAEAGLRKPRRVEQAMREERLRQTLLSAAFPAPRSEEDVGEGKDVEETEDVAEEVTQGIKAPPSADDFGETRRRTQPLRIVAEPILPAANIEELPPDERFITQKVPLTRRKRQITVNPDFASARAGSRRRFDSAMLELPDAPVYRLPERERDALQIMNDVPSRLDFRGEEEEKKSFASDMLDFVKVLVIALILGVLLTHYVIQRSVVEGSSMHPNLLHKDQLIVEKVSRYFTVPARGRIITMHHPENRPENRKEHQAAKDDLVKRVIALPGDTVSIRDGGVYVNNERLDEPYIAQDLETRPGRRGFDDLTLGENEIYVLGDNRPHSSDSRSFGPVRLEEISGGVLIRIWPIDRFGVPR